MRRQLCGEVEPLNLIAIRPSLYLCRVVDKQKLARVKGSTIFEQIRELKNLATCSNGVYYFVMKPRTVQEMIRVKERTERGAAAPAKVWELRTEGDGRIAWRAVDPEVFQRLQREAWDKSIAATRQKLGLSQGRFAKLLGISVRTLHHWEQGTRMPSGAARVLLKVAALHPEALLDAVA